MAQKLWTSRKGTSAELKLRFVAFKHMDLLPRSCVFFAAISQAIGLKIARTALKSRTWCCGVKTEAIAASLGPMYVLSTNLTENQGSLFLRFWSKIQCEPLVYSTESLKYLFLLFPSPILCVDFIFEVTLVISLLPTEKKTTSGSQKSKHVFSTYFKIAGT